MDCHCSVCKHSFPAESRTGTEVACPQCGQRAGLVDHELIQLSRYRVVAFLGSGSSAAVYKAHDKGLQRDVAIKVMHAHLLESRVPPACS